jgi:catechol 2,3-dioxygenase-like lactoylglutathione lyase family enzyme
MSYIALATESFDTVARFYGELLGFPVVADWDRPDGRGRRFDLGGRLRVEILDNARKREPVRLHPPGDRVHLVVEVPDIDAARSRLAIQAPAPVTTSWHARLFQVRDPDGVPVTFLQWKNQPGAQK